MYFFIAASIAQVAQRFLIALVSNLGSMGSSKEIQPFSVEGESEILHLETLHDLNAFVIRICFDIQWTVVLILGYV